MKEFDFFSPKVHWTIPYLSQYSDFFVVTAPILFATWLTIILIVSFLILFHFSFHNKSGLFRHCIITITRLAMDFTTQTLGHFDYKHFCFVGSLFIFLLLCNLMGIVPFMEEPTSDINTPLALGVFAFLYVNAYSIKSHGIIGYCKEFFEPFFLMFPIHLVGKLSGIISISFRLFGNMFGGSTISNLWTITATSNPYVAFISIASGLNIVMTCFFGIFESLIQAFVFTILTLTQLAVGIQKDDDEETI